MLFDEQRRFSIEPRMRREFIEFPDATKLRKYWPMLFASEFLLERFCQMNVNRRYVGL